MRESENCDMCGGILILLGQLGDVTWFRCEVCGWEQAKVFGLDEYTFDPTNEAEFERV